jgi:hypothetical protein
MRLCSTVTMPHLNTQIRRPGRNDGSSRTHANIAAANRHHARRVPEKGRRVTGVVGVPAAVTALRQPGGLRHEVGAQPVAGQCPLAGHTATSPYDR